MQALRIAFALLIITAAALSYLRWGRCAVEHKKTWRLCRAAQVVIVGLSTSVAAGAVVAGTP